MVTDKWCIGLYDAIIEDFHKPPRKQTNARSPRRLPNLPPPGPVSIFRKNWVSLGWLQPIERSYCHFAILFWIATFEYWSPIKFVMSKDIAELLHVQLFYAVVLLLLILTSAKRRRERMFYFCMTGLFVAAVIWLTFAYFQIGPKPDPGSFFAWEMFSILVPGIFVLAAMGAFVICLLKRWWRY